MNKQIRYYVSVALSFLLAGTALIFSYIYLSHAFQPHYRITAYFDDARGVTASQFVQMAGINVGQVASVDIDETGRRAKMELDIDSRYRILKTSDFTIKGALLGGQSTIAVIPPPVPTKKLPDGSFVPAAEPPPTENDYLHNGDIVQGNSSDIFATLTAKGPEAIDDAKKTMAEVGETMRESRLLLRKFGRLSDDMDRSLNMIAGPNGQMTQTFAKANATLAKASAAADALPQLTSQIQGELTTLSVQANQLLATLQTSAKGADKIVNGAGKLTDNLNATLTENRASLRSILRSADDAASAVAGLTDSLKSTVANPKLQANLEATTANLASVTARIDNAASSLERLSNDPRLSSDIRETVGNLKETSASIRNLTARVETIHIPGEKKRPAPGATPEPPPPPKPISYTTLYEPGLALDSTYDTKGGRYRLDTDYTLMHGPKNGFYRFGLSDVTESNRLDLQAGRTLTDGVALRYGIVDGKIGSGLDFGTGPLGIRFDLFDPNRFTINARGRFYIGPTMAITGGVDSLGHENRATVGVTIRK